MPASSPIRPSRSPRCSRRRRDRRRCCRIAHMTRREVQWQRETKERVGIVGVGRMGLAMLKHLVKHGYPVTACDLDDEAAGQGARGRRHDGQDSPAELARAADFVILGVGYDDEVNAVVLRRRRTARRSRAGLDHRGVVDRLARYRQAIEQRAQAQGHRRARRTDLPRTLRGRRGHAAGAGRRQARRGRARARGLRLLLLGLRPSRRCRPRPGRQDHEQPAALDQCRRA